MTSKPDELDLELKLRTMRLMWGTGHFTRRNIGLERDAATGKKQLTDIDVYALRFSPTLTHELTITDCKSGRSVSTAERLFWLRGVMEYAGAHGGLFVRTQLSDVLYAEMASGLGITTLGSTQLEALEQACGTHKSPMIGAFNAAAIPMEEAAMQELKAASAPVHVYLRVGYWWDPPHRRALNLLRALRVTSTHEKISESGRLFLTAYATSLLSLALVQFSRPYLHVVADQKEAEIIERMLGGRAETREKRDLMENFFDFMVDEIDRRYRKKYPISKKDFMTNFYPAYSRYLVDIVSRISTSPSSFRHVPRLADVVAYEGCLQKKPLDENLLRDASYRENHLDVRHGYRSVIVFAERTGSLDPAVGRKLRELVQLPAEDPSA